MSEQAYSCRLPYFFQRRHICSYCGAIYGYPISGEVEGMSPKSETGARVDAEKKLEKIRERTALDKPCPNCGRYSSETLAYFSVGDADGRILAPLIGGLAAIFASTFLLTADVNPLTVLLAFATCGAIAFFVVASWERLKRMNASPGENLAALANDVKLRSELFDIRTKFAWGREVDKSTFQILEYFRLARLVFPAFAVLYFFGRATGAFRSAQGWEYESVWRLGLAMIGTAIALAVLEGRAGSEENRFQGKRILALDGSEKADAETGAFERKDGDGETFDEPAAFGATSWNEAREDADWNDASAEAGLGGASAENADFAARPELSDEREEAVDRLFATLGERDESSGTEEIALEQEQTSTAPPTNRVAPVVVEETSDEAEVAERERVEREQVERERAERERVERERGERERGERERAERERVERERAERERAERERAERERAERERGAALAEAERARKAEERKEGKRLGKYDASPSRLSRYNR